MRDFRHLSIQLSIFNLLHSTIGVHFGKSFLGLNTEAQIFVIERLLEQGASGKKKVHPYRVACPIPMVRVGFRVSVGVRIRGAVPAGTGLIGFENRRS